MPEIPFGLSFDQNDDGFVLRRKEADGSVVAITMAPEELVGFRTTVALWLDRRMSQARVESGSVQPIVVHPIAQVRLVSDALEENALMTVAAPSGEQMTLSFPPGVADYIVAELPNLLATIRRARPARQ